MVRVEIIGNLGRDSAVIESKNGGKFLTLTVAAREFVGGEEKTQWFDCVWFNYNEKMVPFLKKGSGIYVAGTLHVENEIGNDGATYLRRKVSADYVTFNSTGKAQNENNAGATAQSAPTNDVPSMYGSKTTKTVAPEVVKEKVAEAFQPKPSDDGDLPF